MQSSINKNQPENNHEDLAGPGAVAKIRELAEGATGYFCTAIQTGKRVETRPMSVRQVDDHGHLWFLSASDSTQNEQLAADNYAQLMFQGKSHSDFLTLYGTVTVTRDKAKIHELWSPLIKTWFTEGENDPRITVLEFAPAEGYYWDTKHNRMIAFAKMVAGAAVGKTLDDSVQGNVRP